MWCGCKGTDPGSASVADIEHWLDSFERSIDDRRATEHYHDTLITGNGVFIVSTQPGTVDDDGLVRLSGASRTEGYFIAPRMIWVDSIEVAKKAFIEDMKENKWLPLSAYTNAEAGAGNP